MSYSPELFDIRPFTRPMRMWRGLGEIRKPGQKKPHTVDVHVMASTEMIAKRLARNHLSTIYRAKFTHIYQISWEEYGRKLAGCGVKVTFPNKP